MESINQQLFLLLNASASPPATVVAVARVIATWSVPFTVILAAALWIWGRPFLRSALLSGGAAVAIGLSLNFIISFVWFHPRPFMMGLGHQLLPHGPETSFPSDHATFILSFGFGLLLSPGRRGVGVAMVTLGLATAWARVYLGVHFPFDMLGSLVVALIGAGAAMSGRPILEKRVLPWLETLYERILQVLHLPVSIFPRGATGRRR